MTRRNWVYHIGLAVLLVFSLARVSQSQTYLFVDVLSVSTNAVAPPGISVDVAAQSGLHLLSYYLRVRFPSDNFTTWGIRMSTNNSPNRTWFPPDGIYGGLRGTVDPLQKMPLYWQVHGSPQNVTITTGGLGFYAQTLGYWGRVLDRNDFDVAFNWMGLENILRSTLVGYEGLGDFPRTGRNSNASPVNVYLGLDVNANTSGSFNTTLQLDFYNLGVPSYMGYATPNPFTPTMGQRTSFNFYTRAIDSPFTIRIYTVRGRLIRTLTRMREWDGRNEAGRIVEGGLYIYQIQAENERISGTVVLIK